MQEARALLVEDEDLGNGPLDTPGYVKRYYIYAKAKNTGGGEAVEQLSFHMGLLDPSLDGPDSPGVVFAGKSLAAHVAALSGVNPFLGEKGLEQDVTPLDIAISAPCYVIILLYGSFWKFSAENAGKKIRRIKAKKGGGPSHSGRYGQLKGWNLPTAGGGEATQMPDNQPAQVVSMLCGKPETKPNGAPKGKMHGFNFYVTLNGGNGDLPIIIDPNVENRGGNG